MIDTEMTPEEQARMDAIEERMSKLSDAFGHPDIKTREKLMGFIEEMLDKTEALLRQGANDGPRN